MSMVEFIKELEYLLQDIPDEEKADALAYYQDYLEEAGEEAENAIKEFGSPERIAAIIRADIAGHLEGGGEFTERGYEDERFKDPNYQVVKRYDLPEVDETSTAKSENHSKSEPRTNNTLKVILWIVLAIVTMPLWVGVGGGVLGILAGIFGVLVAIAAVVIALTVAFFIAGLVCGVAGVIYLMVNPLGGLLTIGIGCLMLGLSFLGMVLIVQVCGRLIPWIFRGAVNLFSRLFGRGER